MLRILAQNQTGPIKRTAQYPLFLQLQPLVFDRAHLHLLLPEEAGDNCNCERCKQQRGDYRNAALPVARDGARVHAAPSKNILSSLVSRPRNCKATSNPVGTTGSTFMPAGTTDGGALTPACQPPLTHSRIVSAATPDCKTTSWFVSMSPATVSHKASSSVKSRVAAD